MLQTIGLIMLGFLFPFAVSRTYVGDTGKAAKERLDT